MRSLAKKCRLDSKICAPMPSMNTSRQHRKKTNRRRVHFPTVLETWNKQAHYNAFRNSLPEEYRPYAPPIHMFYKMTVEQLHSYIVQRKYNNITNALHKNFIGTLLENNRPYAPSKYLYFDWNPAAERVVVAMSPAQIQRHIHNRRSKNKDATNTTSSSPKSVLPWLRWLRWFGLQSSRSVAHER